MMSVSFFGTVFVATPMARCPASRGRRIAVSPRGTSGAAGFCAPRGVGVADTRFVSEASDIAVLCPRSVIARGLTEALSFQQEPRSCRS